MSVITITKENFEEIKAKSSVVMLDFYADWCGPCRMVGPIVHEIADERDDVTVGKINVDNDPELAQEFGVMSIPTVLLFKNGQEEKRFIGAKEKHQIAEFVKE